MGTGLGTQLLQAPSPLRWKRAWARVALVGLSLLVMLPLLVLAKFPSSHEDGRYVWLLELFTDAFRHGVIYPRWLPTLAGGFGYPTFVFYQPLFFYVAMPFRLIPGVPLALAPYLATLLLTLLGGIGAYRLGRLWGDVHVGLFAAAIFLLTPYLYVNLYVRGDLSEYAAMLLTSWPVYFLMSLGRRISEGKCATPAAAGLAISMVLVLLSHPATAMFFWPTCGLLALFVAMSVEAAGRWRFALFTAVAMFWALALGSVYWWPVLQMQSQVGLHRASVGYFEAVRHLVYPSQLVSRAWDFGGSAPDTDVDQMPFQLGLAHLLLALSGLWFGRRDRRLWGSALAYLLLVLLMLPPSAFLWKPESMLRNVQFPWRILSAIGAVQLLCCLGWAHVAMPGRIIKPVVLTLLVLATGLYHCNQFQVSNLQRFCAYGDRSFPQVSSLVLGQIQRATTMYITYAGMDEFLPNTAPPPLTEAGLGRGMLGDRPLVETAALVAAWPLPGNSPHRPKYEIQCPFPTRVLINQFYFPGWKVLLDGRRIPANDIEALRQPCGRMAVDIPSAGRHTLEAYYGGPPGQKSRGLLIFLATALFLVTGRRLDRRSASDKPAAMPRSLWAHPATLASPWHLRSSLLRRRHPSPLDDLPEVQSHDPDKHEQVSDPAPDPDCELSQR